MGRGDAPPVDAGAAASAERRHPFQRRRKKDRGKARSARFPPRGPAVDLAAEAPAEDEDEAR